MSFVSAQTARQLSIDTKVIALSKAIESDLDRAIKAGQTEVTVPTEHFTETVVIKVSEHLRSAGYKVQTKRPAMNFQKVYATGLDISWSE